MAPEHHGQSVRAYYAPTQMAFPRWDVEDLGNISRRRKSSAAFTGFDSRAIPRARKSHDAVSERLAKVRDEAIARHSARATAQKAQAKNTAASASHLKCFRAPSHRSAVSTAHHAAHTIMLSEASARSASTWCKWSPTRSVDGSDCVGNGSMKGALVHEGSYCSLTSLQAQADATLEHMRVSRTEPHSNRPQGLVWHADLLADDDDATVCYRTIADLVSRLCACGAGAEATSCVAIWAERGGMRGGGVCSWTLPTLTTLATTAISTYPTTPCTRSE